MNIEMNKLHFMLLVQNYCNFVVLWTWYEKLLQALCKPQVESLGSAVSLGQKWVGLGNQKPSGFAY